MRSLRDQIQKISRARCPVLLLGESGMGKEDVARALHEQGAHANEPFVPVDCGALNSALIESELFGHVRGAFTDAWRDHTGLLGSAGRGSIFLDEIGELPEHLQPKLLRVLQEKVL